MYSDWPTDQFCLRFESNQPTKQNWSIAHSCGIITPHIIYRQYKVCIHNTEVPKRACMRSGSYTKRGHAPATTATAIAANI
jgi:hypothetical protein